MSHPNDPAPLATPAGPTRTARSSRQRAVTAIVGVALAGGVALAAWAVTDHPPRPGGFPPPPGLAGPGGAMLPGGPLLPRGPLLDHLLDQIDASAVQRSQLHQLLDAADADLKAGFQAGHDDRERMAQLFAAPVVDEAAIEALRQRDVARHDAASKRMVQALVEVSHVLTVEQRVQLQALMHQARAGHHAPPDELVPPPQ